MEQSPPRRWIISFSVSLGLGLAAAQLLPDALLPDAGVLARSLLAGGAAAVVAGGVLWLCGKIPS